MPHYADATFTPAVLKEVRQIKFIPAESVKQTLYNIRADEVIEGNALPPEQTELMGLEASFGFLQNPFKYVNNRITLKKGKSSVPLNMISQNLSNLASLRGSTITFDEVERSRDARHIFLNDFLPYIVKHPFKALLKTLFSYRGPADLLPGLINYPVAAITASSEFLLKMMAGLLTKPFRRMKKLFDFYWKKKNPTGIIFTGILTLITLPFWAISQTFACAGNVLAYTRHVVDSVMSLFSWGISKLTSSIKWFNETSQYASPRFALKSIAKNLAYLIPTFLVTAAALFIPGGQVLPAIMTSYGTVGAASAALSLSSVLAIGCQALSGVLHMVFKPRTIIVPRSPSPVPTTPSSPMLVSSHASEMKVILNSVGTAAGATPPPPAPPPASASPNDAKATKLAETRERIQRHPSFLPQTPAELARRLRDASTTYVPPVAEGESPVTSDSDDELIQRSASPPTSPP